ncbi:MAG: tRNA (N(6)-L-threonylcarbamoyladenosine(37)-C(2))-methylthiotransferase MtaB [Firmicutes bacterium]|nr:tRNA (N(6)-L-threonylcarbamoyladenosine(37)-C(2))-methylthiotransferase MtaB [Bacillota bacterium]
MELNVTFKVINFGCPVSQYESEAISSSMKKAGFIETSGPAEIIIVNSCVVTGPAAAEARRVIRKAKRENPVGLTVMAGCYPQVYHRQLKEELPEADMLIGTTGRKKLPQLIRQKLGKSRQGAEDFVREHGGKEIFEDMPVETRYSRARPVVKIQEGCDEFCTYCIVARARGKPRSMSPDRILEQVRHFVDLGHREIILAGNHLGIYGKDIPGWNLVKIIKVLDKLPGRFRVRLNYIEPMDINENFLETIAQSKRVCHHLYLPLQSGSNKVLKRMGRRYAREDFCAVVKKARELMPDLSVYTDIIVGFPGETEIDHQATVDIVENLRLSRLHIFPYSPRPGTPAVEFKETVRPDIKKQRLEELWALDTKLSRNFHALMQGRSLDVLIERLVSVDGQVEGEGLSGNNVRVTIPLQDDSLVGEIVQVKVCGGYDWGVAGKMER